MLTIPNWIIYIHTYLTRSDHGLHKVFLLNLTSLLVHACSESFSLKRHCEALTPHTAKFLSRLRKPALQTEHWTGFSAPDLKPPIIAVSASVKALHSYMLWVLVKPHLLIAHSIYSILPNYQGCHHGCGALRVCASGKAKFGGRGLIFIRLIDIMEWKKHLLGTKTFLKPN